VRALADATEESVQNMPPEATGKNNEADSIAESVPAAAEPVSELRMPLAAAWPSVPPEQPEQSQKTPEPVSAPNPKTVPVCFGLFEPNAKQVSLCGDFNNWSTSATPMKRGADGRWEVRVVLPAGQHQYKFVVDGGWIPDPAAPQQIWNYHGTLNSVVEVKA
jgi:hypothetical protein